MINVRPGQIARLVGVSSCSTFAPFENRIIEIISYPYYHNQLDAIVVDGSIDAGSINEITVKIEHVHIIPYDGNKKVTWAICHWKPKMNKVVVTFSNGSEEVHEKCTYKELGRKLYIYKELNGVFTVASIYDLGMITYVCEEKET